MTGLVSSLGVDPNSNVEVFVLIAIYTFTVTTVLWVVGLRLGSHSIMDAYYGFGYAIPGVLAYAIAGPKSATAAVLVLMVLLHGCRLGYYLFARWRRYVPIHGGDPRYLGFVTQYAPGYWWKSFFRVMEPQAVIIVLIGSPVVWGILQQRDAAGPLGILAFVGMAVFGIGLYFESLGDGQLQAFLADKNNKGRYLQTGVWTFTRHPNYFGTTTIWWGMWLVAVSGDSSVWWTAIGPLINTIMLTSVFGSKFQDEYMGVRPAYREVMMNTRRFLPLPMSAEEKAKVAARLASGSGVSAATPGAPTGEERPAAGTTAG
jgi:steroid 5-alpha reductase family enzyme